MDEVDGLWKRYDEAAPWTLISEPKINRGIKWVMGSNGIQAVSNGNTVDVRFNPLQASLSQDGEEQAILNGGGLYIRNT